MHHPGQLPTVPLNQKTPRKPPSQKRDISSLGSAKAAGSCPSAHGHQHGHPHGSLGRRWPHWMCILRGGGPITAREATAHGQRGFLKNCCLENPRRAGIWLLKRTRYHMPKFSAPNTKSYTCDFKIPDMGYCASSTLHQRASSRLRHTPGTQLPGHCSAAPSHLLGNHLSTHSLPPSVIPALQLAVFPASGP